MTGTGDEIRVCYVGSDPGYSALVRAETDDEWEIRRVSDVADAPGGVALDEVTLGEFDCVVADDADPDIAGLAVLDAVRARRPDVPFVFVTGPSDGSAVDVALEHGATDFFRTGTGPDRYTGLGARIRAVVERYRRSERETALREESSQLDAIFEDLPVSLYFKDEAGRHVRVSRGHAMGYEGYYPPRGRGDVSIEGPADFLGKTDADLFSPGNAEAAMADDRSVIEDGESLIRKVEHLEYDDGGERWLTTTKVPWYGFDGEIRGLLGFSLDITERKRYEQRLKRQNERLAEFANIVSHDLRNPLNVAAGRLELFQRDHDTEHLEAVERAHDRMGELIDDLLGLARYGQRVEGVERVTLDDCLDRAWGSVRTDDATLRVRTDATPLADSGRLQQLFENLFRNAIEHSSTSALPDSTEEGVTVTVGDLDGGFFVEDDGPGIPESAREQVFERSYTTTEDGTGFGLAIVAEIVDAHGWEIRVTDGEAGGARFEITGVEFADE
jgi:signal transduction histidine kinase